MLFSGDQDFICNSLGTERLIADLSWSGGKGMGVSLRSSFKQRGGRLMTVRVSRMPRRSDGP
jgi:carboxypeptidase C (cathepsin A)